MCSAKDERSYKLYHLLASFKMVTIFLFAAKFYHIQKNCLSSSLSDIASLSTFKTQEIHGSVTFLIFMDFLLKLTPSKLIEYIEAP